MWSIRSFNLAAWIVDVDKYISSNKTFDGLEKRLKIQEVVIFPDDDDE
jgi:hypothetical protein